MATIRAALFDLDGTLVDSHDDIATALALALADQGLPAPDAAALRRMVGAGARTLIERAVAGRADVDAVYRRFGQAYRDRPVAATRLYAGVGAVLDQLVAAGTALGVVSNKPHDLTVVIVAQLLAAWPFATVAGHRPELPLKPDPAAALRAAGDVGVVPARCAFIGDSDIDVATARAAGMRAVAVTWGFRDRATLVAAHPDVVVDEPAALVAAILGLSPSPTGP